jgi:hypothetical protein
MQIMFDTETDGRDEARAVVATLETLYPDLRTAAESTPKPEPMQQRQDSSVPPAPAPAAFSEIVSDDDPEVTIDDDGNIASVILPPPPPPAFTVVKSDIELPVSAVRDAAPPAPPAAPPAIPVDNERDTRSMPWDGRIHASNRAKTIKGDWKYKRGADKNLIVAVEAGNVPGNTVVKVAGVPTALANVGAAVEALKASHTVVVGPNPPAGGVAPSAPAAVSSTPPPPPAAPAAEPVTFRGLMQKIMKNPTVFTEERLSEVLGTFGLTSADLVKLMDSPLLPSVNSAVDACLTS